MISDEMFGTIRVDIMEAEEARFMDFAEVLFYGIPCLAIAFFVFSLVRYLSAARKNRRMPGSVEATEMRQKRTMLIVASAIFGVLLAVVVFFTALLMMAVAYM